MNGLVRWFVANPIAANLLMLAMLVGGISAIDRVEKEVFPAFEGHQIDVSMSYPGAASSEVEQQIVVRIEEAIADLPGIFQISSRSSQGFGMVNIRVIEGYDVMTLLADVKSRIDAINTFPTSAERPIIRQQIRRSTLMYVALFGDASQPDLKRWAYQIRDELTQLEGIAEVNITGVKNDELAIEISEEAMQRYNLSFDEISQALRGTSLNVPAGTIRSKEGDIQIQTRAQAFAGADFENIVVRSQRDGGQLLLSDIADIKDGFEETNVFFTMNGKPGLNLELRMSDDPKLIEGTQNARDYVKQMQATLPEDVTLKINFEMRSLYDSRFNLLKDNALGGLVLVFLILMLFLRPMLAFWVVVGIGTTFAGALWFLPYLDVSLNMLSMFAFLMVLGIVVDDAIIIGESVYRHQQMGDAGQQASILGAQSVLTPVTLAVMSTILFFVPMIDVPSEILVYTRSIFWVVFLCLLFSLIESLLVLPSHLSHMKPEKPAKNPLLVQFERVRLLFSDAMAHFARVQYQRMLATALSNKLAISLLFLFVFAAAVTLVAAGWIKTSFMPQVPNNFVMINVGFEDGSPFSRTQKIAEHIRQQVEILKHDEELLIANAGRPFIREINRNLNGNNATVFVGLVEPEHRIIGPQRIADKLRVLIGPIPEAKNYSLNAVMNGGGADITLNMSLLDNQRDAQERAVQAVTSTLARYPGVFNVRNNLDGERTEVELSLRPFAETLGINMQNVARQVRQAFYGEEIQRIPRAKEDVRVMLRYSLDERSTLDTLDSMRVRTLDGREIPLNAVAEVNLVPGPSTIRRIDRRRNIQITAEVEEGTDANAIVKEMLEAYMPNWRTQFNGIQLGVDGTLRSQARFGENFQANFIKAFIAVLAIFAITFRSAFQPFLVMLAVPFGFVGACLGHLLLGQNISMMSFFGFLACAGVVVNDNLVLLTRINQLRARGQTALDAVLNAGVDRFRPIVLTSLTTFVGLLPILFEQSLQAQFLIPMVISLSFGVMFSSVVTLFLVPCGYYGGVELRRHLREFFNRTGNDPASQQVL